MSRILSVKVRRKTRLMKLKKKCTLDRADRIVKKVTIKYRKWLVLKIYEDSIYMHRTSTKMIMKVKL